MRAKLLIAVCALALGALGSWLTGRQPPPSAECAEPEPPANAPARPQPRTPNLDLHANRESKATPVSLDGVYTTAKQVNLKSIPAPFDAVAKRPLFAALDGCGSSHAFLVSAPDIVGALGATKLVLMDGDRADRVDPMDARTADEKTGPNKLWLFVLLGPGSEYRAWKLEQVNIAGATINFHCTVIEPTVDALPDETTGQAYWCPLPPLQLDKEYQIVVRDGESTLPLLTRRVRIAWR